MARSQKPLDAIPRLANPLKSQAAQPVPANWPGLIWSLLATTNCNRLLALELQQARCAIESLPYETPKLSATAIATMDGKSFAEALDRAIERSKLPPMLNAPTTELVDATELKKPMSRYRRF